MAAPGVPKGFRDAWWFRLTYLALLGVLAALLFPFAFGPAVCLVLLVIPLTMFIIPYWFGERRSRKFIENGLVVFVIALVALAALRTQAVASIEPFEIENFVEGQDPTMALRNGSVQPFRSEAPTTFTFRVLLRTTDNATPGDFEVWMNLTTVSGFDAPTVSFRMVPQAMNNTRNGTWFTNSTALGGAVYGFGFAVHRVGTGNWTETPIVLAPIAASAASFFGFFILFSLPLLGFTLAVYFIFLMLWWYLGRMRARVGVPPAKAEEEDEDEAEESPASEASSGKVAKAAAFTCTNCGADVTEDAATCPKCGATFDE